MFFQPFTQPQPLPVTTSVAVEPVYNVLLSLALLTADPTSVKVEPWITETAARLTPQQRHDNRLVFEGLGQALLLDPMPAAFPDYLTALAAQPPTTLTLPPSLDQAGFVQQMTATYPRNRLDGTLLVEIYQLRQKPEVLHQFITTHLRALWETHLAAEWERSARNLQSMNYLLNKCTWPTTSAQDAIRAFFRRPLPDAISAQLGGVEQVVFVPSPHVHLHAERFGSPDTIWIFALANFWTLPLRTEPIQRTEVLAPLSALADETRLHILELLATHQELFAQELITKLEVSQPTVSRHLKQLRSANLITEQRGNDANKSYQLNPEALERLFHTLTQLLSNENAQLNQRDARLTQPVALRRFLDRAARVTIWPAKRKDQQAVLDYLIAKFAFGQDYTEAQVNDLLNAWHTYGDPAYLRRSLISLGLFQRTPDGARYWRAESRSSA
ncbi:MAG: metalloregulator ArsR/SmtB family transcription factor [Caldilineaceae bacterium]